MNKIGKVLCITATLSLVLTLSSGCAFRNKTIDVTNSPAWWGSLAPNEVVRLKQDVLVGSGGFLETQAYIAHSNYHDESVTVESYKANPAKWPDQKLVKEGTKLRCLKLKRYYSFEYSRYKLDAEILNGDLKGKIVDIGWWLVSGNPDQRGSLNLNAKFLEPVR